MQERRRRKWNMEVHTICILAIVLPCVAVALILIVAIVILRYKSQSEKGNKDFAENQNSAVEVEVRASKRRFSMFNKKIKIARFQAGHPICRLKISNNS